ncbi:MAG TPA: hotdog domain-containing protein [Ktedonobacterales bacterium]|jgi:acyl dehydratase
MITGTLPQVGTAVTLSKAISEADVALFTLLTDDHLPTADEASDEALQPREHQSVPPALVSALLAGAAARHGGGIACARIAREEVRFVGDAFTDDTLTVVAEVVGQDATSGAVHVRAHCTNQDAALLAEGSFEVRQAAG